jgi:hypothetical protein
MGIRTVCFLLAIVLREHWSTWVFLVGAVFLPYVAVVMANAGAAPDTGRMDVYTPEVPELETGRGTRPLSS